MGDGRVPTVREARPVDDEVDVQGDQAAVEVRGGW